MGGSLWIISMGQIESERWVTLNWTSGSFSIGTVGQLRRIKQILVSGVSDTDGAYILIWDPSINLKTKINDSIATYSDGWVKVNGQLGHITDMWIKQNDTLIKI